MKLLKSNSSTYRLALSYLAVIMAMSLCFSGAIYIILSSQLNRPLPPRDHEVSYQQSPDGFEERMAQRDTETRMSVLGSLAILNVVVLAGGSALSYYLARRTLAPIEAAMEAQTQFISDASHEIRTPLTALQTSNEVALRKKTFSESKARDVFGKNIVEIEKLRGLADALLSLAKTDHVGDSKQAIELDEFLSEIVQRVQPLAYKKGCAISIEMSTQNVVANVVALEQIVTILLDNAIKYSPETSQIYLTSKLQSNKTVISVRDYGIGIGRDDLPHIFDRFYRADSARTRTDTSGHGLGLAIAKQLADRYDYELLCRSEINKGSTFEIWIGKN